MCVRVRVPVQLKMLSFSLLGFSNASNKTSTQYMVEVYVGYYTIIYDEINKLLIHGM